MLYYVFDDEQTAVGAEAYICQLGGVPVTGVNAATGELEPDAVKTERWAVPEQRLTDGKWVFPYVGDELVAQYPDNVRSYFAENFPYVLEEPADDWFPPEIDDTIPEDL